MSAFGASETKLVVEYDAPLRNEVIRCGEVVGLQVGTLGQRDPYLDHGTFVPLYFLREAGVDSPYGFAPEEPEFDRQITEAMASGDFLRFLTMAPVLCERAAECGLRSFQIMASVLDGLTVPQSRRCHRRGLWGGHVHCHRPETSLN